MSERNRFEVIINAIKTGTPIATPRSRFEEVINAIVGAGGSSVSVTAVQESGTKIATITIDDEGTDIYSPIPTIVPLFTSAWTGSFKYGSDISGDLTIFDRRLYMFKFKTDANDGNKVAFISGDVIRTGTKFTIGSKGQSDTWLQVTYNPETGALVCNNGNAEVVEIMYLSAQTEIS